MSFLFMVIVLFLPSPGNISETVKTLFLVDQHFYKEIINVVNFCLQRPNVSKSEHVCG